MSQDFLNRLNAELGKVHEARKLTKSEVGKSQDAQKAAEDLMRKPDDVNPA